MASFWIKYYIEILDDPKMATLPDRLWRRFSELCLMAGGENKAGILPDTPQIAWRLRMSTDELTIDLNQLASTGMIERIAGGWLVVNFAKRQAASPEAERKARQRERERHGQYHEDVTKRDIQVSRNVTQIDRLTDNRLTDTDREIEGEGASRFDLIHNALKVKTGSLGGNPKSAVDSITKMISDGCELEDIMAGCDWLISKGKTITHYDSIVGPANHARLARIQNSAGAKDNKRKKEPPVEIVVEDGQEKMRYVEEPKP